MKRVNKIKLNSLSKIELNEKEMNRLLGGQQCCICHVGVEIGMANYAGGMSGLYSSGGGYGIGEFA